MSYRFTVTVCGRKVKDEIREGDFKMPDIAGFCKDMKKLGIKTAVSVDNKLRSEPLKEGG